MVGQKLEFGRGTMAREDSPPPQRACATIPVGSLLPTFPTQAHAIVLSTPTPTLSLSVSSSSGHILLPTHDGAMEALQVADPDEAGLDGLAMVEDAQVVPVLLLLIEPAQWRPTLRTRGGR